MRTILKDDDVLIVGANVPVLLHAGDPESAAAYKLQTGNTVGKATGRFPVVGGLTYVECSDYYPGYVPDELGGGINKTVLVYVASAFVVGDVPTLIQPGTIPSSPGTPSTPAPGPTAKPTGIPVNDQADLTGSGKNDLAADQPQTSPWLTWGLGAVLLLSILGLLIIIGRTSKKA